MPVLSALVPFVAAGQPAGAVAAHRALRGGKHGPPCSGPGPARGEVPSDSAPWVKLWGGGGWPMVGGRIEASWAPQFQWNGT